MSVSGAVLDRLSSTLAGPTAWTGAANAPVVYESPSGSASVMSVSWPPSLKPTMEVLYGSVALGSEGIAGYVCVADCAGPSDSDPSLIDRAVPLGVASRCNGTHVVPGTGQSVPDVVTKSPSSMFS